MIGKFLGITRLLYNKDDNFSILIFNMIHNLKIEQDF